MTISRLLGVRVAGIASAVPEKFLTFEDDGQVFGSDEMKKVSSNTGVKKRHVAPYGMCTSDLCFAATEQLLKDLNWSRNSIDALIFLSQSPDYPLPATACVLQARLGLPNHCAAFDVNLGCSAYPYGIWLASHLIAGGGVKRALVMVGDISTRGTAPKDRATAVLFGDGGAVTALERDDSAPVMTHQMGTDGQGGGHLIVRKGGCRHPYEYGDTFDGGYLHMDGAEIFTFTLREVPPLIKSVLTAAGWSMETVDAFVMHQANEFILKHLMKKMKIPPEKMILAMEEYGNTSSASIPLAITHSLREKLRTTSMNLVLAGFGVGLSWAAVALNCDSMVMPELVLVDESAIFKGL